MHASNCVPYKGQQQTAEGYTWANIDFNGQVLPREIKTRIFAVYVLLTDDSPLKTDIIAGGILNDRQSGWAATKWLNIGPCGTGSDWPDIGYTFVIGEDGNVYEARGWDIIGAHTYNYNYNGL
ncbi:hypothetical protein LOTGIDRAFT_172642, partial [Lottia gigantea]